MATVTSGSPGLGRVRRRDLPFIDVTLPPYSADPTGVVDSTTAFNNAIAAANAAGGSRTIYVPSGSYLITSALTTIAQNGVHVVGDGAYSSLITFTPTADANLFTFSKGASVLYNCSISRLAIYSADTSYDKIAVNALDTSQLIIDDLVVDIRGFDSVGIRLAGRETSRIYRSHIIAPVPIRIAKNPNTNGTLSCDHMAVRDVYLTLIGNADQTIPKACVLVDDEAQVTNLVFDGGAWVGGDYGFYMVQTSSPGGVSYNIDFRQVRHEQSLGGGQSFRISPPAGAPGQGFVLNGCYTGADCSGIYARNLTSLNLRDCTLVSYPDSFDVNFSVQEFMWENTKFGLTAGATLTSMKLREASNWRPDEDQPRSARYSPYFGNVQDIGTGFWGTYEWAYAGSLANNTAVTLPCVNDQWNATNKTFIAKIARIDVSATSGSYCEAGSWIAGQSGGTSSKGIRLIAGTSGCSEVSGDSGKLNVEATGAAALNANVQVVNRLGGTVDILIRVHWYAT